MKRWLWIGVGALVAVGAAFIWRGRNYDPDLAPVDVPILKTGITPVQKPAGKPGPLADKTKIFAFVDNIGWYGGSENGVNYQGRYQLINEGYVPVHNILVELSLSFRDGTSLKKQFIAPLNNMNGMLGMSTQGVLMPGEYSESIPFSYLVGPEYWRRYRVDEIRVIECEKFDDRSNLHEPMQLQAFIRESSVATIKKAFEADPALKDVQSSYGRGPLQFALMQADPEKVKYFESIGFDIHKLTRQHECAYHFAVYGGPKMIDYVHSKNVATSTSDSQGFTPVQYATQQEDVSVIPALKRAGISLDSRDGIGNTPLILAIANKDWEITEALYKNGARRDIFSKAGVGPLSFAVITNRSDFLEKVAHLFGTIDERTAFGNTPLHIAVQADAMDTARWLLSHGADPHAKNKKNHTPADLLHLISNEGDQQIMRGILEADYSKVSR